MLWYLTPYALLPVIAALIAIVVCVLVWQRRSSALARPFVAMMAAIVVWCIFQALELSHRSMIGKVGFTIVEYYGIATIPIAWLCFALVYSGWEHLVTRRLVLGLVLLQLPTFLGTLTNSLHYLFWSDLSILTLPDAVVLQTGFGPLWYYHLGMSYLLILIGTVLTVRRSWLACFYPGSPASCL